MLSAGHVCMPFHGIMGYTAFTLPFPSCDLDRRWTVRTAQQPQGSVLPDNLIVILMTLVHPGKLALPQPPLQIRTMSLLRHASITTRLRRTYQNTLYEPTVPKNFWEIRDRERSFKASYRGFWQRRRAWNLRELLKFRDIASPSCFS